MLHNYTPKQLEAISTLDRNLQIIACAGSGKTQVISQRIIEILKTGIHPSKIIAFTYTEKAAGELQARILKLCKEQIPDKQGIADMYVGTIHSWCLNALQEYKYEYQKFRILFPQRWRRNGRNDPRKRLEQNTFGRPFKLASKPSYDGCCYAR